MTRWITKAAGFLFPALVMVCPAALAQQGPPPVCEQNPEFHQFDFWVGDWDVYSNDGKMTHFGTNSVTQIARDCLVMEHWVSDGGSKGYSMNFFDAVTGKWRQVWVSNGNNIDYQGGLNDNGQMVLEGTIHYYLQDLSLPFRGTWTPNPDGTVIQYFEQFDPETETWKPWSKVGLLYVPKEPDTGPEE